MGSVTYDRALLVARAETCLPDVARPTAAVAILIGCFMMTRARYNMFWVLFLLVRALVYRL